MIVRRVMALWLPSFSTDLVKKRLRLCGARDERARTCVLLTRAVAGRELVVHRCVLAAAAGVRAGIDLAQARSQLPAGLIVHVEPHRPDKDEAALHRLACWALRVSPTVATRPPDGVVCDLTGTARLYGREMRVARSVARAVNRLGLRVRIAVASTFGCAAAVARFGGERLSVVEAGRERETLGALPVAALCFEPGMAEVFAELGMELVEEVLALPRRQLASRFGPALLHRIDLALGHATEVIEPVHPPPPITAEILFDGPTDRFESVEAAARDVLEMLVGQLVERQRGVRRLDFVVLRPRGGEESLAIQLSRASVNGRHLWMLLRSRLERVDMGEQVDGLRATATRTARLRDRQGVDERLDGGQERGLSVSAAVGELTDALVNRLGPENVVRFVARESHLPEKSFVAHSVMEPVPREVSGVSAGERPTVLFGRPEPVSVMALTPDGPVLEIGWRDGRERVTACIGPERIGPEWWRWRGTLGASQRGARRGSPLPPPPPADRDYFAVQLASGPWLWVCRQAGTTRWFVHGEWG